MALLSVQSFQVKYNNWQICWTKSVFNVCWKRSTFILNSTHFNFLCFSKALVSCAALSNICFLRDSEDIKAHSGHGWKKAKSAFAQLYRLKRLNRSNQPQKGMVIWRSVQRGILARDKYKRRDGKEAATIALCQHWLQTRLGSRLLAWLGTFPLYIYSLRSIL